MHGRHAVCFGRLRVPDGADELRGPVRVCERRQPLRPLWCRVPLDRGVFGRAVYGELRHGAHELRRLVSAAQQRRQPLRGLRHALRGARGGHGELRERAVRGGLQRGLDPPRRPMRALRRGRAARVSERAAVRRGADRVRRSVRRDGERPAALRARVRGVCGARVGHRGVQRGRLRRALQPRFCVAVESVRALRQPRPAGVLGRRLQPRGGRSGRGVCRVRRRGSADLSVSLSPRRGVGLRACGRRPSRSCRRVLRPRGRRAPPARPPRRGPLRGAV